MNTEHLMKQQMDPRLISMGQGEKMRGVTEGYATAPTQLRPVEQAIENLGKYLGELNRVIVSLEGKMQPYINSPAPPSNQTSQEAYPGGSMVTVGVIAAGIEIKSCIAAIRSLMDRMD